MSDILASTEAATDLRLRVGGFTVRDADGKLRVGVLRGAGRRLGCARVGRRHPDRRQRPRRRALERQGCDRTSAPRRDDRPRPAFTACAPRPSIPPGARAQRKRRSRSASPRSAGSRSVRCCSASRAAEPRSLQLEFGSEPTARASFDIYGGTAGQRLSATLELSRDLDGPAIAAVPLALTRADDTRVVATGTVPLGALAPGDYVVRGIIRLEDGATGRVVRTLRKVVK